MRYYAPTYQQKPAVVEKPKCEAKPHMMPGLTKEMLMSGRARPARRVPDAQ